ncbi:hypothetical protein F2A37_16515 [Pseudomonas chlororaphis]|uniref:hypothetical protein n=1 Tax=Pseudomonas chlororaphis TaxID=587753 RepID=UPI0012328ADF|nr:hypothetical protein [Pseudomonas chlororaphis]KAA5842270.1 hypothetical protein F2A37_16515 [Pseudomonas chlororaphis]
MINYKEPTISELLTNCMVTWSLGKERIALTAEASPPTCEQIFCKDGARYKVIAVCGPYSYRWADVLLMGIEAEPCA